ncbi:MAG: hypothetical protein Ct9H90mP7_2910 [Candidatus Neomarinimicrobiota bacterium]|nr:MAG: hypothetical protein Ct9H90mP7_2910 [Candidatus Neomarinimicrobiota bacterium]
MDEIRKIEFDFPRQCLIFYPRGLLLLLFLYLFQADKGEPLELLRLRLYFYADFFDFGIGQLILLVYE